MPKEVDGLVIFDEKDLKVASHEAFIELKKVSLGDVVFPFGFRIVELEDDNHAVVPLSEEDWLSYMKRTNPNFDHGSAVARGCYQTGPKSCSSHYCGNGYRCTRAYDPKNKVYWCGCQ